jgi:hypothetical protein
MIMTSGSKDKYSLKEYLKFSNNIGSTEKCLYYFSGGISVICF